MLSRSIEDYIKAIYTLESESHKATTKRVAERLGVKMASVTGMIKHLAAEGYARHTPYYGVRLSERGRRVAINMIRRHRLIELFLSTTLGLTWDEVDADAEVLEHVVSDRLIERMFEYLDRPEFDPHGAPIPAKDGSVPPQQGTPLNDLREGDCGRIVEVSDRDPEVLRYLTKLRLHIGTTVTVCERAPFNGPITLRVASRSIPIGTDVCKHIRVAVGQKATSRRRTTKGA